MNTYHEHECGHENGLEVPRPGLPFVTSSTDPWQPAFPAGTFVPGVAFVQRRPMFPAEVQKDDRAHFPVAVETFQMVVPVMRMDLQEFPDLMKILPILEQILTLDHHPRLPLRTVVEVPSIEGQTLDLIAH